jgi:hypothetical protein
MMTLGEFIKKLSEILNERIPNVPVVPVIIKNTSKSNRYRYNNDCLSNYWSTSSNLKYIYDNHKDIKLVFYNAVEIGGMRGGSCWDDTKPEYYSGSADISKWDTLDLVLETLFPAITVLTYRKLQALQSTDSYTDYEYYGNTTDYHVSYFIVKDLYDFMVDNGVI